MPNVINIGQTVFEVMQFFAFQVGGPMLSWICLGRIWTTQEGYLVVFITVQNFVVIEAVVLII